MTGRTSTRGAVQNAASSQHAMLYIAEALDRIEAKLDAVPPPAPAWDDWSNPAVHRQSDGDGPIVSQADRAEMAFQMGIDDEESEAEALAREARVIDAIAEGKTAQFVENVTVDVPPVSHERNYSRSQFATNTLRLHEELGTEENWVAAYAKGGPAWLYAYRPDLVKQYSVGIKQELVRDLEIDDPQAAAEMARDILKAASNPPDIG